MVSSVCLGLCRGRVREVVLGGCSEGGFVGVVVGGVSNI